ncbi:MAG: TIGR01777 family protein [Verrucomicrobiales bacterium]|nr:TIGR01777 family protein [Verrucomicrobiales bacterium]
MNHNSTSKRIILAGGSGFLGRELAAHLESRGGYEPVILTRNPDGYEGAGRAVFWDGKTLENELRTEIERAAAIINLAGKNVNCRPSEKNREEILTSRTDSVRVLGEAVRNVNEPPPVWIQASSLAIYGDAGDAICDESARVDEGFPANVCTAWEEELGKAILPNIRWAALRIGFVLGKDDGALPFLAKLVKLGLGGSIGNGKQWISWIHLDDMIAQLVEALENPAISGIYNATGPNPVTNADLMTTLRRILNRPWSPPAPAFAVRIGAPILDSDPEIALTGRRCIPKRLTEAGFEFRHPDLESALRDILKTH